MNKMKLSAIVLGIAAAGAIAQNAPAAAPAAAPAQPAAAAPAAEAPEAEAPVANADSVKAAEEAKAAEAKKAEEEKAAAEAKKAEEEKAAAEAKKAEEEKAAAEAKKAEEEKAAAEAKKAEEEKQAAEAKKAEEAKSEEKTAEAAPAAENTNVSEVANAAGNAMDALKASMSEGTSKANMEVKISGEVELDAYTNDILADGDLKHSYATTVDVNFDIKFNEKWTAFVGLEADDASEGGIVGYNGAYVQYKPADFFAVKLGDLTFSEGAFKAYYGYDDPTYNAAGMKEHDIRGMQIELAGLELGFGFARNANDFRILEDDDANYNLHLAYEFNYAGQHLRPYVDYKSYQEIDHNELHAGIDAGLTIGGFSFRAVYGFHADFLGDDDDNKTAAGPADLTSTAHTILAEPTFEVSMFKINTTFFYAFIDDGDLGNQEYRGEIPEYMFAYAEPTLKFAEFIQLGIPVEFHTNSLDDEADISTLDVGARFYLAPVENLNIMATGMVDIPVGDNNDDDDVSLRFGVETVFNF